ncbi:MAG: GFA family protein, partial [Parasphingopyxis sp.]
MSIEGGCYCGAVRYRIEEEDPPCYACFCTDCQTRSGSTFALTLPVWRSKFVVEGECVTGARTLATGAEMTIHCCAECLTGLYSENDQLPDLAIVRAGTLDDGSGLVPAAFMWTRSKQAWIALPENARSYETQPDHPAEWMDFLE